MANTLSTEQFPLIAAACAAAKAGYQQRSLQNVIDTLNKHLPTGKIPNPDFQDAKHALNTAVDTVRSYDGIYQGVFSEAYQFEPCKYQLDFMYANQVPGKLKLATKKGFKNETWLGICNEIVTLYDALQSLKDGIVKRQVRSEEERAEDYVPPIPKTASAKLVNDVLKKMTDPLTKEFADRLYDAFVHAVEYELAHPIARGSKEYEEHMRLGISTHCQYMSTVGDGFDSVKGIYTSLVPDYKKILREKADWQADCVQRQYLYKNVTKLVVIIERKGNALEPQILSAHVAGGTIGFGGEVLFTFADGASFVVRNKAVHKISVHGRHFVQFPTTFHNAKLPGGAKFENASEERMIELYSKVTA